MSVDSFKFLPRLIATFYQMQPSTPPDALPWTPLQQPIAASRIALISSAGIYLRDSQQPFAIERERHEPLWGDPGYRVIPKDVTHSQIAVSHLHVDTRYIEQDLNVALPLQPLQQLATEGTIASVADEAYSVMGYQGYPPDPTVWRQVTGPAIAERLRSQQVDGVVLVPT